MNLKIHVLQNMHVMQKGITGLYVEIVFTSPIFQTSWKYHCMLLFLCVLASEIQGDIRIPTILLCLASFFI